MHYLQKIITWMYLKLSCWSTTNYLLKKLRLCYCNKHLNTMHLVKIITMTSKVNHYASMNLASPLNCERTSLGRARWGEGKRSSCSNHLLENHNTLLLLFQFAGANKETWALWFSASIYCLWKNTLATHPHIYGPIGVTSLVPYHLLCLANIERCSTFPFHKGGHNHKFYLLPFWNKSQVFPQTF